MDPPCLFRMLLGDSYETFWVTAGSTNTEGLEPGGLDGMEASDPAFRVSRPSHATMKVCS